MLIIGLTGSIAWANRRLRQMFRAEGIPVHDSDATVHALYRGAAVESIDQAFPGVVVEVSSIA